MLRSNRTRSDFLLRDGVKTIEEVHCGITVRIACAFPNRHVQVFRERLGNQSQHLASCGRRLLSVSLGGTCAKQGRDGRVRFKVSHYRTEERFQGAVVQLQVGICLARGLVRSELRPSGERTHTFLVANARATSHEFERFLAANNRQAQEVGAVLACRVLIFL